MDSRFILISKSLDHWLEVPISFADNPQQYADYLDNCCPQGRPWQIEVRGESESKNHYLEMFL